MNKSEFYQKQKRGFLFGLVVAAILSMSACGGGSNESSPSGAGAAGPSGKNPADPASAGAKTADAQANCDIFWDGYVKANPVGLYEERRVASETETLGGRVSKTEVLHKRRVIESSPSEVKSGLTVDQVLPVSRPGKEKIQTTKKEDLMKVCSQGVPAGTPEGANLNITVLAERDETISVEAGTFACKYRKVKLDMTGVMKGETIAETWSSISVNVVFEVKAFSVTTIQTEHGTLKTTVSSQLVKRQ